MSSPVVCPLIHGRSASLLTVTLLLIWPAATANAQPAADTIRAIEFVGLERTNADFARDVAGLTIGAAADPAALDAAVARLIRTGRFLAVQHVVQPEGDGVKVVFHCRERVLVTAVRYEGNRAFGARQLNPLVDVTPGQSVDVFAARAGRLAILTRYRNDGYQNATVSIDEDAFTRTGELVYRIEEGERVRIRTILFEGNDTFPARELMRHIETRTAFWVFRTGAFDVDRAEGDIARLQNFYRDQGFLDARVVVQHALDPNGRDLTVTFTIEENTRYRIESIQFQGHTVFSVEELSALIESRVGDFVKRPRVDADARTIRDRYGELGHLYVRVQPIRVFSESPGLVRITFDIEEGDAYRVGRVAVRGNTRTKDHVVRRALNLYPPDDLLNISETRAAEQRLLDTRIFSSARVTPVGDQPGVRDVVIDVEESEKAGDFLFGAGVTSNSGLVGSIVLDLHNFDITRPPRTLSELIKLRSFFGGGQRLRLELLPGTQVSRFRIDFTEPYLFHRPLRFDASLYYFERGRDGYNERRVGSSVSFGHRFERGLLHGWSGELALRAENVKIDDVDLFSSRHIREDKGNNLLTSAKGSLVRDRTDNRYIPSAGDRLRLSYEQFGIFSGDHTFGELTVGYTWFTTLRVDALERKSVLELRGEGGVIIGNAPVFERFYAGGTGSMRGFAFRGIGERDGIDNNNIGGDFLILLSAEYSYPLYGDNLRGHVFLDTGTAGNGPYRAAVGTGIRFTIDLLGPFPLEFNLAFPVSADGDDDRQVFSFLIGRLF